MDDAPAELTSSCCSPLRGGHDQGRRRRRRRGLHPPPTSTYSAFGDTYALADFPRWWPPPPRACSWSGRRALVLDADAGTGTGEQPLCFVDQTDHAMRIGWYTDTYRRTERRLAAGHPADDVPAARAAPATRAGRTTRPGPAPTA